MRSISKMLSCNALALSSLCLTASGALATEGPDRRNEIYRDWVVQCVVQDESRERQCRMHHSLRQQENGQRILTVAIERPSESEAVITIIPPFGLLLPDGISILVDEVPMLRLDFLTCFADGCIARASLSAESVDAMQADTSAVVRATMRDGSNLDLEFSLMGFTAAWNRLGELE